MLAIGFVDDPGIGTSTPLVQKFLKNACLGRTPYPDLVLLLKNSQAFSGLPTDLNPRFLLLKLVLQSYLLGPEAFRSCFLSLSIARRWAIAYTTRPASAGSSIPCGGTEGPRTAGPARARARGQSVRRAIDGRQRWLSQVPEHVSVSSRGGMRMEGHRSHHPSPDSSGEGFVSCDFVGPAPFVVPIVNPGVQVLNHTHLEFGLLAVQHWSGLES